MRRGREVNRGWGVVSSSGFGGDLSLQLTAHGSGRNRICARETGEARPSRLRREWAGMSKDREGKVQRTQVRAAAPGASQKGESEKEE